MNGFDLHLGLGGRLVAGLAVISLAAACQTGATLSPSPSPTPSPSPAVVRYDDPVGDQTGGVGPDIVAVTVSQPSTSTVRFTIEFAIAPPLGVDTTAGSTDTLMVFMGTAPDFMTARTDVFAMALHGATLQDDIAQGVHLSVTKAGSSSLRERVVRVTVDGATATMTIDRGLLGHPSTLYFVAGAGREGPADQSTGGDMCPEDVGEYDFTVR